MRIEIDVDCACYVTLSDIGYGGCFILPGSRGCVYMKVRTSDDYFTAISLERGNVYKFEQSKTVIPVNAVVHISKGGTQCH